VLVKLTNTILALFKMMSNIYPYFKKIKIGEAYLDLSYIYLSFVLLRPQNVNVYNALEEYIPTKYCLLSYKILFIILQNTVYYPTKNIDL